MSVRPRMDGKVEVNFNQDMEVPKFIQDLKAKSRTSSKR
jgi:hypothetical protein